MDGSELDNFITILRHEPRADSTSGEDRGAWKPVAKLPCNYRPTNGREGYTAESRFNETDARFTIRWTANIKVTDRLDFEGATYRIIHLQEIPRHEGIVIFASARAEDQLA